MVGVWNGLNDYLFLSFLFEMKVLLFLSILVLCATAAREEVLRQWVNGLNGHTNSVEYHSKVFDQGVLLHQNMGELKDLKPIRGIQDFTTAMAAWFPKVLA